MPRTDQEVLNILKGIDHFTYDKVSPAVWVTLIREKLKYCPLKELDGAQPIATILNDDRHNRVKKLTSKAIAAAGLAGQTFFDCGSLGGWLPRSWEEATDDRHSSTFYRSGGQHPAKEVGKSRLILSKEGTLHTLKVLWKPHEKLEKDYYGPKAIEFWYEVASLSLSEPLNDEELTKIIGEYKILHPGLVGERVLKEVQLALAYTAKRLEQQAKNFRSQEECIKSYFDKIRLK